MDECACLKEGLSAPPGDSTEGWGCRPEVQLSLGYLGGREAPGSFSFRQEAACSYLHAPAAFSALKLWVEPLPGEPPRWGLSLQLQTRKPWLRGHGQAQPLSQPLGLRGLGGAMLLGAENRGVT